MVMLIQGNILSVCQNNPVEQMGAFPQESSFRDCNISGRQMHTSCKIGATLKMHLPFGLGLIKFGIWFSACTRLAGIVVPAMHLHMICVYYTLK